ncbi:hypothetical protein ANN_25733 [Periplaneta americana]|uniref:Uncharacterized protein n=1 Tax=Periplaneta americana TaxID=6978 RepID=A0ABQ8S4A8_PERAM|nr:hypothetical protein ANN_25733 [Periplaneta americana]
MAGLCEGGNEPSGSLKAICKHKKADRIIPPSLDAGPTDGRACGRQRRWRPINILCARANPVLRGYRSTGGAQTGSSRPVGPARPVQGLRYSPPTACSETCITLPST